MNVFEWLASNPDAVAEVVKWVMVAVGGTAMGSGTLWGVVSANRLLQLQRVLNAVISGIEAYSIHPEPLNNKTVKVVVQQMAIATGVEGDLSKAVKKVT